ncbi:MULTISPECIES: cupin domain-containing protein [Maribacter]|uniref:cupin domain-containing protein n=1 Tax=Maribacter TaxID=252356 RepID=UPI0007199062|nr:cupin domain-containing protein [Maribacter dokdonensis]KSA14775.1 Cupin [Maribacter dokdonensis DSW-8]CAG2531302.1 Cupin domain-containing protein [Maribacter dokdonensis]
MDRQSFIKKSGAGISYALCSGFIFCKSQDDEVGTLNYNDPKVIRDADGEVLNVIGDIQTHKLLGSETNNQIFEWVDNVEPGVGIPPHVHTKEDEIFRVVEGEVEIAIDGESTVLKAGDIAFAPKGVPHTWKVVGSQKAKMITSALPAGIEIMFQELSELPAGPPDFEKVAEICAKQGITFV